MLVTQFRRLVIVMLLINIIESGVMLRAARKWKFVIQLVDNHNREKLQLSLIDPKPWLMRCNRGGGVCLSSKACPWEKLKDDVNGDCVDYDIGTGHVCCEVNTFRIPTDMFEMYDTI